MKTVTPAFASTISGPGEIHVTRQVSYKRRYWNGSAYVWESSWTAIAETQVIAVSPITAQLDTQTENEFQVSNCTITLINFQNQWVLTNPQSIFGPDANSTLGYAPNWTKFQINAGLVYPDGTSELVTLFTGVATDFNFNSTDQQVQITVSGKQIFLVNTDAQTVSTTATLESLGTGDGTTKIFNTAHNGVGIIFAVYVAGVIKSPGTDYTLSNVNNPTTVATVTFITAPASSAAITCTYTYWLQGQKFETLVADLATASGIPGGNQQITPVTFPNSIINSHTYQTQTDWQSGSLTDIDTTFLANSIKLDFTSTDARQLTTYADATTGWSCYSGQTIQYATPTSYSSNYVVVSNSPVGNGTGWRSLSTGAGRWNVTINFDPANTGSYVRTVWHPVANTQAVSPATTDVDIFANQKLNLLQGYAILMYTNSNTAGQPITLELRRTDAQGTAPLLATASFTEDNADHVLSFIKYPNGLMLFQIDGVTKLSATDTTYATGSMIGFTGFFAKTGTAYIPAATLTGTWIGPDFDSGATPTAWTALVDIQTLNGGTITYYTAASSDNITYDAYVAIGAGGIIGSALKRYLKLKIVMVSTLASHNDPLVTLATVGSTTSSTVIAMADFTGMTAYDAITDLAGMANYEFGFDAVENFFFRPKSASLTPVMALDQKTFICDVLAQTTGAERIYSSVVVTYGAYTAEVNDPGGTAASPSTTYGYNQLQPGSSSFLISADANVAAGMAQTLFAFWSQVRSEIKIATTFLPQLDLSDIITLSFQNFAPSPAWFWGDPNAYWGMPTLFYYGAGDQLLNNILCKVVGYRIDTDDWSCEYDLEEV